MLHKVWLLHGLRKTMQDHHLIKKLKFEHHENSNSIFPDLHYWYRSIYGRYNNEKSIASLCGCFCCMDAIYL